jgi:hypothetical protein
MGYKLEIEDLRDAPVSKELGSKWGCSKEINIIDCVDEETYNTILINVEK